jgi:hypothetical protein
MFAIQAIHRLSAWDTCTQAAAGAFGERSKQIYPFVT